MTDVKEAAIEDIDIDEKWIWLSIQTQTGIKNNRNKLSGL